MPAFGYYLGAVADDPIDQAFKRLAGVSGTDLRRALQQYQGALEAAKNAAVAAPYSPAAWAARDAAHALQYEIDTRPELKTGAMVPAWLLTQIRDNMKKLYRSVDSLNFQAAPLISVVGGAIPAAALNPNVLPDLPDLPSLIPMWVKVAAAAAGGLLLYGIFRAVQVGVPTAARVAERRLQGVTWGRGRRSRRRRRR